MKETIKTICRLTEEDKKYIRSKYLNIIPPDDFEYKYNDDGTVTITKYVGISIEVNIPPKIEGCVVTNIGEDTFEGCGKIITITIPDSVTSIGQGAFRGCSSLTNIIIPDSVTYIGYGAFYGCSSLTNITIPDSVVIVHGGAFDGCSKLIDISVDTNNKVYFSIDGVLFSKIKKELIRCPEGKKGVYIIPYSIKSIGCHSFRDCLNLVKIVIPDSVESIDYGSFSDCSNLLEITIPDSVKSIDPLAFILCSNLTKVFIPNHVKSIGYETFEGCCNLESVVVINRYTKIGRDAFNACNKLVLYGKKNSKVQRYAKKNNIKFKII